jgi:type IV pilus assembly protein PilC
MFSRLSLSVLIELCRVLRHYLGAGLSLEEVFRQQMTRGPAPVRPIAARIALVLRRGGSLESALEPEKKHFPPMFLSLARVGERTGMLPEVFSDLEQYFIGQQQLRRRFLSMTAWPLTQFVIGILVVSLVILILGLLPAAEIRPGVRYDPLGLGLFGVEGALTFVGIVFGSLFAVWLGFWLLGKLLPAPLRDRILLGVPVIGPCLRDLALMRFCLALRLTTESGMSIGKAIRLSMEATANAAFADASPAAERTVAEGDDLTLALQRTGRFPHDFLRIIEVAEASGTMTDVLHHQADHYREQAARRMSAVSFLLCGLIWLSLIGFVLLVVVRFMLFYTGMISDLADGKL